MKAQITVYGRRPGDTEILWLCRHVYAHLSRLLAVRVYLDIYDLPTQEPDLIITGYGDAEAAFYQAFDTVCAGVESYVRRCQVGLPLDEEGEPTRGLEISLSLERPSGVLGASWTLADFWIEEAKRTMEITKRFVGHLDREAE